MPLGDSRRVVFDAQFSGLDAQIDHQNQTKLPISRLIECAWLECSSLSALSNAFP